MIESFIKRHHICVFLLKVEQICLVGACRPVAHAIPHDDRTEAVANRVGPSTYVEPVIPARLAVC